MSGLSAPTPKLISDMLDLAADYVSIGWCQRVFAHTSTGRATSSDSPDAVGWCILGALERATSGSDAKLHAEDVLAGLIPGDYLDLWNDVPHRTQTEVIALLRKAARIEREKGR